MPTNRRDEASAIFIGAHDDLVALQQHATQTHPQLTAKLDRLVTKSTDGVGPEILVLIGTSIVTIGRCVNVYLRERKKRIVVSHPDRGSVFFENFTDDQIKDILAKQSLIRIKDAPPDDKKT
jgi:hypothetical protein